MAKAAIAPKRYWSSGELASLILKHFPSPEWAVFFEVSNTTGFGANRRADAVALGIWPSRGCTLIGMEIKSARRDWLKERSAPEKADSIASMCDVWWVVAPEDVVKVEELPEPWGLLSPRGEEGGLKMVKQAIPFEGRDKTVIKRTFVASMLRKVTETMTPNVVINERTVKQVKALCERDPLARQLDLCRKELDHLRQTVDDFQRRSGVKIDEWDHERIADAVATVMNFERWKEDADRHAKHLLETATRMHHALAVAASLPPQEERE